MSSTQRWKLRATNIGTSNEPQEVTVESDNWMNALLEARRLLGEPANLPPGSSCAVAADGKVTVVDAASARTYSLFPSAEPETPSLASSAPAPAAEPDTHTNPMFTLPPASAGVSKKTLAYDGADVFSKTDMDNHALTETKVDSTGLTATDLNTAFAEPFDYLELHSSRDHNPSEENPLSYRERAYFCRTLLSTSEIQHLLEQKLHALEQELRTHPPGKLIRLAVFAEPWKDVAPPPRISLEWKDWPTPTSTWAAADFVAASAAPKEMPRPAASPAAKEAVTAVSEKSKDVGDPLSRAFEGMQDLFFLRNATHGMEFTLNLLQEIIPSQAFSGCLYDINRHELRFVAVLGPGKETLQAQAVDSSRGLLGAALLRGSGILLVNDVSQDARFDKDVDSRHELVTSSVLLAPLVHDGRIQGVLQLINRNSAQGFSSLDTNVLSYVASQLSQFLQQMRMSDAPQPKMSARLQRR